jgi:hypothetical protein
MIPVTKQEISVLATESRPTLRLSNPSFQLEQADPFVGVKRRGHETDHSPPTSVKGKDECRCTSNQLSVVMAWCSARHADNFTYCNT